MNVGDKIESAIWMTGDEHPAMRRQYELDVIEAIDYLCAENSMTYANVEFTEKHPMDTGVMDVPDHVSGSRVRLLVGEATVTGKAIEVSKGSFVGNLDRKDLMKLRGIIRRHGSRSNEECDYIIEQIGPEAALETLRSIH